MNLVVAVLKKLVCFCGCCPSLRGSVDVVATGLGSSENVTLDLNGLILSFGSALLKSEVLILSSCFLSELIDGRPSDLSSLFDLKILFFLSDFLSTLLVLERILSLLPNCIS